MGIFEARLGQQAAWNREQGTRNRQHGTELLCVTFSSICYFEFLQWYAWVNFSGVLAKTEGVTFSKIFLKC